jgi:hypothetical protein
MTFLNPTMLAGLGAALVPLILHLLNRSRYRNVDWGAMMFLRDQEFRRFHRTRLKQWALLALRSMILAVLAVALARPVIHARGLPPTQPGRTAAVILLDRSASMGMNDNGRMKLELAREAIFQLLSPGFKRGDDLWLVPLGERDPTTPARYGGDPQEMANLVKEVTRASGQADIAAGLREAMILLSSAEAPNREIYVICDRQANSWKNVDEAFTGEWRRLVARLPRAPRLFVLPVGSDETGNVAISEITPLRAPLVTDQPADVEVKLHNHGPVPRAAVTVDVQLDGPQRSIRRTVNLPAQGDASVIVPVQFGETGSHVISAVSDAPGTAADKRMEYSVDVMKDIQTLIVDGDEQDGSLQSGAGFLRMALEPFARGSKRNTATVTIARPEAWGPMDLRDKAVLVLANVPTLTEAQADAMLQFVYGGGGLIVAPGDQCRVDNYNAQAPWLPASLQAAIADSGSGSTSLGNLELGHPVFRFLGGKPEAAPAAVRRYFPATLRRGASAIATYADGKPFLIESAAGRGRILLLTTPIDVDWNALPLTHFFLPFAQSLARHAAGGLSAEREAHRNLLPGQPIVADFEEPLDPANVVVQWASSVRLDPSSVAVSRFDAIGQVRCAKTFAPGLYSVWPRGAGNGRPTQFVVRAPAEESDLTPLADSRWRELERDLNIERIDAARRAPAAAQEAARSGVDLWLPMLGAAIVLGMIELLATRRWAGGEP